jgi:hypothetical protein
MYHTSTPPKAFHKEIKIYDSWTSSTHMVSSRVNPIWDTHPLFTFALWFPLGSQQGHTPYGYLSVYQSITYVFICLDVIVP